MESNKYKVIFFSIILFIISLSFVSALDYNFPVNNLINSQDSNTTYKPFIGYINDEYIIVGAVNSTGKSLYSKINLNTNINEGNYSNSVSCSILSSDNVKTFDKTPNNLTTCVYNTTSTRTYFSIYNSSGHSIYSSNNNGLPVSIVKSATLYSGGFTYLYFLLNDSMNIIKANDTNVYTSFCYSDINSTNTNYLTTIDYSYLLFTDGNDYYYNGLIENCSNDVNIGDVSLNFSLINSNDKFKIINDTLYISSFDTSANSLNIYTSSNVDIYSGLVCGDNLSCYKQDAVCLPNNEFYTGVNSSNYLCQNVSIVGNDIYCNVDNLSYCAGGCTNTQQSNIYGVTYTNGVCGNSSTCDNDCNVEGLTYSDTSTSYKICGFYDTDTCLDWSSSIPCSDGEYSENGFCNSLNTSGVTYYSLRSFTSTPDLERAINLDYNSLPPTISYNEKNNFKNLGVDYSAQPTSFYINKVCNYNTTSVLKENVVYSLNTSNSSKVYTIPTYSNGDVKINFKPSETDNERTYFLLTDSLNNIVYNYSIAYNSTNNFCLYDNDSLLGCEAVDYIDLIDVEFTIKTTRPQTTQLSQTRTIINKVNGGFQDIFTGFKTPDNTPVNTITKLNIVSENTTIKNIEVYNEVQQGNAWKNTTWTQLDINWVSSTLNLVPDILFQHYCLYTSTGTYTLRSYYADNLNEGNWNYKDWEVNINKLGDQTIQTDNSNSLFNGLSKTQKILLGFGISFIIFMIVTIIGLTRDEDGEKRMLIFTGVFLFFASLIVFALIEWIPVWIIIMCGLIASGLVGLFFVTKSNGG